MGAANGFKCKLYNSHFFYQFCVQFCANNNNKNYFISKQKKIADRRTNQFDHLKFVIKCSQPEQQDPAKTV